MAVKCNLLRHYSVGVGASSVLSGLRQMISAAGRGERDRERGERGEQMPEGIGEGNKKQGVPLSMPPT